MLTEHGIVIRQSLISQICTAIPHYTVRVKITHLTLTGDLFAIVIHCLPQTTVKSLQVNIHMKNEQKQALVLKLGKPNVGKKII